jgi:predicted membrane protein DUF2254
VIIIVGAAVLIYFVLHTLDRVLEHPPIGNYFNFADDRITDAVGGLSSLFAAILGIIITVVSIIVQLSAERFTNVTQMFLRDKTNIGVLAFYVVACLCGVLNSFSVKAGWVPRITLTAVICLAIISFALMAPYFAYVFDFLRPTNIIERIRVEAQQTPSQARTLGAMEELTDITINSISGKDKIIAVTAVDALKEFTVQYLGAKKDMDLEWFVVGPGIRRNPDFVSMAEGSVEDIERRHTWVEFKVLRQYQAIYYEALASMRDVAYVIAIDTRYIGEAAISVGDKEALGVCLKFFNTYLRATLNAKDVRTAYNVLHQYRELAEALLRGGWHERAAEVAGYIKYYGHISFRMQLPFVTETCAYDLCSLCELAHDLKSPVEKDILRVFLEVDQPASGEGEAEETGLRGVRKAQIKLATYYIVNQADDLARRIYEDMKSERPERLKSMRDELLSVVTEDFWEVIDRGRNFDYLTPDRKKALNVFYSWFTGRYSGEVAAAKEAAPGS